MKENQYKIMSDRHQKEFNELPISFAFSKEQLKEGMEKLGLTENDTDKVIFSIGGSFFKKTDLPMIEEVENRHKQEFKDLISADKTGEGFIKDMFSYELENHEYGYTRDPEATLLALGISQYDFKKNPALLKGFELASREIIDKDNEIDIEEEIDI